MSILIMEHRTLALLLFQNYMTARSPLNGVAKAFAMTGWRIGYIGAPAWIAKACNKMQGQITSGANCIAQRATITALGGPGKQNTIHGR